MRRRLPLAEENEEIMKLLLKHGDDSKVVSDEKLTMLHVAAAIGSTNMIRELMEEGLNLEARDIRRATTLHIASGGAHRTPRVIRYLTDNGQEPLGRDSSGWSPLHYAAKSCNVSALEALLEVLLGRDGLSVSEAKRAAIAQNFSRSAHTGCGSYGKVVEYVNVADDEGKSLLHVVGLARKLLHYDVGNENEQTAVEVKDTVRMLVDLGAKVNLTASGKNPLLSLLQGEEVTVKELLDKGANPNIPDKTGANPLHHSARG